MSRYAKIKFEKITDVMDFLEITKKVEGDVLLLSESYRVNGKSLMGIFSLDLSKVLTLEVKSDKDLEKFKDFILEEEN